MTPYLPWPADTGGKLRSYYLIRGLAETAEVDLYTVCYGPQPEAGPLGDCCRSVTIAVLTPPPVRWPRLRALTQSLPRSVTYFHTADSLMQMRRRLNQPYDLLISDEINMAPYWDELPRHGATPRLMMRQKIDYLHYAEMARSRPWGLEKLLDWQEARRLKRFEFECMPQCQAAVVCSPEDAAIAAQEGGATLPLEVIVNGADVEYFTPVRTPDPDPTILLLGTMHYYPNIDAALYFFETIYPALLQAEPKLKVLIVGHLPPPEIQALGQRPGVTVTGSVPDVRPYMARSWITAVPLRLGGGTRLKIVESMAGGLPVVSTGVGAQGLQGAVSNEQILVADAPAQFVAEALRLLRDPALRTRLAENARRYAVEHYSWQRLGQHFADFCHATAHQSQTVPLPQQSAPKVGAHPQIAKP